MTIEGAASASRLDRPVEEPPLMPGWTLSFGRFDDRHAVRGLEVLELAHDQLPRSVWRPTMGCTRKVGTLRSMAGPDSGRPRRCATYRPAMAHDDDALPEEVWYKCPDCDGEGRRPRRHVGGRHMRHLRRVASDRGRRPRHGPRQGAGLGTGRALTSRCETVVRSSCPLAPSHSLQTNSEQRDQGPLAR